MIDIILDAALDSLKLLPFLFITYLVMELLEHHEGERLSSSLKKFGSFGPAIGAVVGVIPQCGLSAAASSFYAGRVITVGTLIAVFLSTSDEMLPILISESIAIDTILRILLTKVIIAIIVGFIADLFRHLFLHKKEADMDIHTVCEEEHCSCEDGVFTSAVKHTVKIFLYIFIISLILNSAVAYVSEEALASAISGSGILGYMLASLIGLIPNCASSVVITKLYVSGIITSGIMMAGLLVNSGVGLLVLLRLNRNYRHNFLIVLTTYVFAVLSGLVLDALGIVF